MNRQVPLDWFESVAIVAGLCSALGEQPATATPALEDIQLTAVGAIALGAPGRQADDVVLRLLHDCLRRAAQPPALRLFVLNALSSDRHRSPAALEQELAYYERPGRADIIRSVRARCLAGGEAAGSRNAEANGSSNFEVDKAAEVRTAGVASTRRRRLRLAIGIAACAVGVAAVVTLVYSHKLSGGNIGNMQDLAGYVAETGRGLVNTVTKTLNLTPEAPAVPATADATSAGPAKKLRRARASITSASSGPLPLIGETITTADNKAIQVVADGALAAATDTVDAVLAVAPEVAPTNAAVAGANETMPPRLIDPVRLPKWATIATNRSSHLIELAISETGKVDRVRLVSPAVRMTDMMMLSAAKTWTFEPALENGHPTPYTLTLNVATTP